MQKQKLCFWATLQYGDIIQEFIFRPEPSSLPPLMAWHYSIYVTNSPYNTDILRGSVEKITTCAQPLFTTFVCFSHYNQKFDIKNIVFLKIVVSDNFQVPEFDTPPL